MNEAAIKLDFNDSKYATGRRKKSIAKIWLKKGSGKILVNGKNYNDYSNCGFFCNPVGSGKTLCMIELIRRNLMEKRKMLLKLIEE